MPASTTSSTAAASALAFWLMAGASAHSVHKRSLVTLEEYAHAHDHGDHHDPHRWCKHTSHSPLERRAVEGR